MASNITTERDLLFQKLNQETGKISWIELQRYFAKGVVITVAKDLDLVKIAAQISKDKDIAVQNHIDSGKISRPSDRDAKRWNELNQTFWAVVIAPWVLVQELKN